MITGRTAQRRLDEIDERDPDKAHAKADKILLDAVPPEVAEAYQRLVERTGWWSYD